jgi:hypothetical protein
LHTELGIGRWKQNVNSLRFVAVVLVVCDGFK